MEAQRGLSSLFKSLALVSLFPKPALCPLYTLPFIYEQDENGLSFLFVKHLLGKLCKYYSLWFGEGGAEPTFVGHLMVRWCFRLSYTE